MEIDLHQEEFRALFYDLMCAALLSYGIVKRITDGLFTTDMKLSEGELANKATFEVMQDFTKPDAALIWMEDGTKLSAKFITKRS